MQQLLGTLKTLSCYNIQGGCDWSLSERVGARWVGRARSTALLYHLFSYGLPIADMYYLQHILTVNFHCGDTCTKA